MREHYSSIESLSIVIVLYKTSIEDSITYQTLISNKIDIHIKPDLIIYDNSPTPSSVPTNDKFNLTYIHNPNNPGLSTAYNIAANKAIHNRKQWLLILDQDTELASDALYQYNFSIKNNPEISLFAPILLNLSKEIISPAKFVRRMGRSPLEVATGKNSLASLSPVNSGLCIRLKLFTDVNGYNEDIPLDYSDFDFINRVRTKTKIFYVLPLYLKHSLSASEQSTLKSSITRFRFLCIGLKKSSSTRIDKFYGIIVGAKRAGKLTLLHKNTIFFKILIEDLLR